MSIRRGLLWLLAAAALLAGAGASAVPRQIEAGAADPEHIEVSARPIQSFGIGSTQTRFGMLEFAGGLELTGPSSKFGGLSGLRFLSPGNEFLGVSDTGFWFFGTISRDSDGRPTGFSNFRMQAMFNRDGELSARKQELDAEGLAIKDGVASVGYEHEHRIAQFSIEPDRMGPPLRELDFLIPRNELRQNASFETLAYAHPHGQHEGGLVVVTEKSLDRDGNIFAAIVEGPNKGIFKVKRHGDFGITDGAFLPNGDLLLLERSFSFASGVKMRVRRIYGESVSAGELVDGPVLFEADMRYQIDNMEGMDVWTRSDGAQMVSIISDDNNSILQRNLYLEFILHDEAQDESGPAR